ncbi:peptidoglycan DD-metalloendopeptidase family protein [Segnochrobactraceae bacterium EtOH-i3]
MSRFTSGSIFDIGSKPKTQVAKVDDVAVTGSLPSAPVSSGLLPPPSTAQVAAAAPAAATTLNSAAGSAASYASEAAGQAAAPVANAAVQYKNWSSAGGTLVTVAPGETTGTIARRYGIPEEAILATNRVSSAAQVQPGSQIIIPTYVYGQPAKGVAAATAPTLATPTLSAPTGTLGTMPASAAAAAAAPVAAAASKASAGTSYVVKSGDSLRAVAKRNGLSYKELAAANGLEPTSELKIGQKIVIPGAGTTAAATAAATTAAAAPGKLGIPKAPPASTLQAQAQAQATAVAAPVAAVKAAPVAAVKAAPTQVAALPAQMSDAGSAVQSAAKAAAAPDPEEAEVGSPKTGFRWPARGRVVSGFGKKPNGESNDGINLAVPEGTPVKAAEEGVVVYSGNELQGYGNLVLVRHSNGWVTAYAHNSELLVSKGDTVKRGQVISKAGATGNVTSPQLHFELRKGSRPVDPTPYLGGV